ncbi:cytochrome c3 family protein [bacterium]|nr:cytochrome c3 family protein [bacterium]
MTSDAEKNPPGHGARADYRHIYRFLAVIGGALAVALLLKGLMVPETFGDIGHYRAAAVPLNENLREPMFQGKQSCDTCHDEIVAQHAKDVHQNVECENCHGPANKHVLWGDGELEGDGPFIDVPKSKETCLGCHQRLYARPAAFPQVDPEEHYRVREVNDPETPCFSCHSPHEPLFLETSLSESRKHPMIYQCANCHRDEVKETAPLPTPHPTVFDCGYCHEQVQADFEQRPHAELGCGTCHQFYVESEQAGRIVKHTDPRFCLLCHEDRAFVTSDNKPVITWPEHREEMSGGEDVGDKTCADCHRDAFHHEFTRTRTDALAPEEMP